MNDATALGRRAGSRCGAAHRPGSRVSAGPLLDRRRVLRLALVLPAAATLAGGCATGSRRTTPPDPLIALADAARADAALAVAAVATDPALGPRLDPLRAARTEHAAALDAEVVRVAGAAGTPTAPATAAGPAPVPSVTLAQVRDAVAASQRGAADLVADLPAERVGLVASVAACCATYVAVLT